MHTENRSQRIAVTGATGRVGSHLVEILAQRGHDVVPIARSKGVDVVSGEGLDQALVGVETIIDTATGPSPDQAEATAFFTASARNLQRAGAAAGAKRIIVVSIIGIDKFHSGYNAAKVAQEHTLLEGPLPVRIVPLFADPANLRYFAAVFGNNVFVDPSVFTHTASRREQSVAATAPWALLALGVNGVPLSPDHGFPARVIIPADIAVNCLKWVNQLKFHGTDRA